jgi:hypothetical protein
MRQSTALDRNRLHIFVDFSAISDRSAMSTTAAETTLGGPPGSQSSPQGALKRKNWGTLNLLDFLATCLLPFLRISVVNTDTKGARAPDSPSQSFVMVEVRASLLRLSLRMYLSVPSRRFPCLTRTSSKASRARLPPRWDCSHPKTLK